MNHFYSDDKSPFPAIGIRLRRMSESHCGRIIDPRYIIFNSAAARPGYVIYHVYQTVYAKAEKPEGDK